MKDKNRKPGAGGRTNRGEKSGQPQFKTLRLRGEKLEEAIIEIHDAVVVGLEIIYEHAVRGESEAIRAMVAIAELALKLGGALGTGHPSAKAAPEMRTARRVSWAGGANTGSGSRARKRIKGAKAARPKVLRLKGDCLRKSMVEIYNESVIGLCIIYDCAAEGGPEGIRALVLLADGAIELGGRCEKSILQKGKGARRGRHGKP